jgi:zinc protease
MVRVSLVPAAGLCQDLARAIQRVLRGVLMRAVTIAKHVLMGALCAALYTVVLPSSQAQAASGPEVRLADNVFVVPDKTAKSVTGWLIIKAGCADEAEGDNAPDCRGIAHYLEHLLFINRDADHRSKVSAFAGGSGNGATNMKSTWYTQRFPSNPATDLEQTEKLITYLAGQLVDVKADAGQAERERNIVMQEHLQNWARNPSARFGSKLNRTLMPDEALGQRVGGTPETIKAFTVEAAVAFHKRWYARNNAVLVLTGPIDPEAVKPMVVKHFQVLAERPVAVHAWAQPKAYTASAQVLKEADAEAKSTTVYINRLLSYDEPATETEQRAQRAARGLIGLYLSSKLSGSPNDVLQEQKSLVTGVGLSISKVRDGTLSVSLSAVPASGITPEAAIEAAKDYLQKLPTLVIPDVTLARLKLRQASAWDLQRQEPEKYAGSLMGWLNGHNSYEEWLALESDYANVTPEHVRSVLALLARPGREVIGVLAPTPPTTAAGAVPSAAPPAAGAVVLPQ